MSTPVHLSSVSNDRVKAAVKLREAGHRRETGLFLAEGLREVERAHAAGLILRDGFYCPQTLADFHHDHFTHPKARWFTVSPPVMEKLAYRGRKAEGLVAVFQQRRWTLGDIARRLKASSRGALVLIAVGTTKPGNLGAMLRSADAAGAQAVIACDGVVDFFNPNAIRASTGAVFTLPTVAATAEQTFNLVSELGLRLLAADPAGRQTHTTADMSGDIAIAIGAEDVGLDAQWGEHGQLIRIPTQGHAVDSLNASVAAGVLLFEAVRQRAARMDT